MAPAKSFLSHLLLFFIGKEDHVLTVQRDGHVRPCNSCKRDQAAHGGALISRTQGALHADATSAGELKLTH